jgi:predicted SAM-dependent methyltransferase
MRAIAQALPRPPRLTEPVKQLIRRALKRMGYRITAVSDAYGPELYRAYFPSESISRKAFYNFGAGNWRHPVWTNVDYHSPYYSYAEGLIDIKWDIASLEPFPVADASAELVYSSHTVEHLLPLHVDHMLREAARILKPGGVCRVTTPNIELCWQAYKRGDVDFGRHYGAEAPRDRSALPYWLVNEAASQLVQGFEGYRPRFTDMAELKALLDAAPSMEEALDKFSSMIDFSLQRKIAGHHVSWWTNAKLCAAMQRVGFSQTIVSIAGGSVVPVMRDQEYFDTVNSTCSLFVEGIK